MATNPEISPERVERFIAMHDGMEAKRSKLAFSNAIAQAKAKIAETPIIKNATGHNSKRYADFSAYAKVVDPVLASFGLIYRFRTVQSDKISVTCVLTGHGHEEENTLSGPADASGSKNAIQAIGSTLTYLQRYTLVQALGLAASDDDDGAAMGAGDRISDAQFDDDDGAAMGAGDRISDAQFDELSALIDETKSEPRQVLHLLQGRRTREPAGGAVRPRCQIPRSQEGGAHDSPGHRGMARRTAWQTGRPRALPTCWRAPRAAGAPAAATTSPSWLLERLTGARTEGHTNAAMAWGTEHEPDARAGYEFRTNATVELVVSYRIRRSL